MATIKEKPSLLKESLASFTEAKYTKVKRSAKTHSESLTLSVAELERLVSIYKQGRHTAQTARLLRDSMDHWIRRYHGYVIEGGIGAHYTEVGVDLKNCIFEHVIPAAKVRDMLIQGVLTPAQALNTPTCFISKPNDQLLREHKRVSSSPDYWQFFKRYDIFDNVKFSTYNGVTVDQAAWTLEDHFNYFKNI
jgi:hypothetical protein